METSVKDYFSDKFSNNKAPIVPHRALESAAGGLHARPGLTALAPELSEDLLRLIRSRPYERNQSIKLKCMYEMENKPDLSLSLGFKLNGP